jgi:hypothetical protein
MVWHTHMLNPRAFLEDAMLAGLRTFWYSGMPWFFVDKVIDKDFNYTVSDQCKARWTRTTGLAWNNEDDTLFKTLKCPGCGTSATIPWTTCGMPEEYQDNEPPDLTGNGYGDSNLLQVCPGCGVVIRKELLSVAKFVDDYKALLGPKNRPMPGTLLDPTNGQPRAPTMRSALTTTTFPNRLLKSGCNSIRIKILDLMNFQLNPTPTMEDVRKEIDKVLKDEASLRLIDRMTMSSDRYQLNVESRIVIRKMMSRYWENFSLFALDLGGAVMRQGVFVEKMCQLDWLHSPLATNTMARLLRKYSRFMDIMKNNPDRVVVPTLDVDLAWHTHQLSPGKYYEYTVTKTSRFINHDDKIDQNTLNKQFEWTSRVYQDLYGEVYSECTCWYCEGTRCPRS